jgi:hypothetical protein
MVHLDLAAIPTASDAGRLLPGLRVRPNRRVAAIRVRSWICGSRLPVLPMVLMEARAATVGTAAITLQATADRAQAMEAGTAVRRVAVTLPEVVDTPAAVGIQGEAAATAAVVIGKAWTSSRNSQRNFRTTDEF